MKKMILGFLASIGFLTLLIGGCLYFAIQAFSGLFEDKQEQITQSTILNLQVGSTPFVDVNTQGGLLTFLPQMRAPSLIDTVIAIKNAAQDHRIKGILLTLEGPHITLAEAQELREALSLFKESNKKVYAFAYSFGEGGKGTTPYYLATVANAIFMQPQGTVELTGYAIDSYFFKDFLDTYKIIPQLARREGYKGIIEPYTHNDFSPETQENLSSLLNNMLAQVQSVLTKTQNIDLSSARKIFEEAPYLDTMAVNQKLITKLLHIAEVKDLFKQDLQEEVAFVSLKTYKTKIPQKKMNSKFALISVEGEITSPVQNQTYGVNHGTPEHIARQLRKAAEDTTVDAIILRINSPGGTVTGAETLWYEVDYVANNLKKPVVVSMGTVAASAGYQIAAPATKIIANPGTITGSIGVATGKIALGDAATEFGIHLQQIRTAKHSGMWSVGKEFSPEEWHKIELSLDHYYDIFLQKVSQGRHLSLKATENIAKGQVWSGEQAKNLGLVDQLGGVLTAIDITKQLCNIPQTVEVEIVSMNETSLMGDLFMDIFETMNFIVSLTKDIQETLIQKPFFESKLRINPS